MAGQPNAAARRLQFSGGELLLFDQTVPRANFSRSGIEAAMITLQLAYRPPDEILNTFAKPSSRGRREPPAVVWSPDGATCGTTPTVTLTAVAETSIVAPRAR